MFVWNFPCLKILYAHYATFWQAGEVAIEVSENEGEMVKKFGKHMEEYFKEVVRCIILIIFF